MSEGISKALVLPAEEEQHPSLFAEGQIFHDPRSPEAVCRLVGLNWLSAVKLHESGWLSFDPKEQRHLSAVQEAELTFLGALVVAGCDDGVLRYLLSGLQKPYAYRLSRVYYDWAGQTWRLLEDTGQLEARFDEWVDDLAAWQELRELERLRDQVERAIERIKDRRQRERVAS